MTPHDTTDDLTLTEKLEEFFRNYYDDEIRDLASRYPNEQRSLVIDWFDLYRYDHELADDTLELHDRVLPHASEALGNYDLPVDVDLSGAHIRLAGAPDESRHVVGEFSPSDELGRVAAITGQVDKISEVQPIITTGCFECQLCGTTTTLSIDDDAEHIEPHECQGCERQGPFRLVPERTEFEDYQELRLTTPPERIDGTSGTSIDATLRDDLTDRIDAGDRVTLTGQLRIADTDDDGTVETYLDCRHVEIRDTTFEDIDIDDDRQEQIDAVAAGDHGDPLELLLGSLAPTIQGHETLKTGLLLSLFGGVRVEYGDGTADRGDIHTLMIGDPGVGKSTLLEAVRELSPRSVSASGRGASKAGMTAAAVKDDFGGGERWTLDAGALVLANKGVVTVDEIDKLGEGVEESMHEAMSQQYVSVNKAGINATLPARTTVVASGNPKDSRFGEHEPIGQQIPLSPTIRSRFDLIFALEDTVDPERDSDIAVAKVDSKEAAKHDDGSGAELALEAVVDGGADAAKALFRAYVAQAKTIDPQLTDDARELLRETYVGLRAGGDSDAIPIGPRTAEALVRLAEASARARHSDTATTADVIRAKRLVEHCLNRVATNEFGDLDVDIIEADTSHSQRERVREMKAVIAERQPIDARDVIDAVADRTDHPEHLVRSSLDNLAEEGTIYETDGAFRMNT